MSTAATPTASPTPAAQNEGRASGLGTPAASVTATTDYKFDPSTVSVKTGDVIQWTNMAPKPIDVTFEPGAAGQSSVLSSTTLQPGDTWQVKILVPGDYAYLNTLHSGMVGHVTVSS